MLLTTMLAALILGGAEPGPVTLEVLPSKLETLAKMPQKTVKVEVNGSLVIFSGTPLASILEKRAKPMAGMAGLRDLADAVLLVRGADGYQVAVSAVSAAMDPNGERYLLANARNGQTISPQLIVPADPQHARWVRDVAAIRLVRLNAVVNADP